MCFEFGSCFGNGRREDYGGERSTHKTPHSGARGRRGSRRNGEYAGAADNKAPPAPASHQQLPAVVHEAGQKAYHDGAWKDHHTTALAGGHGGYAAYLQDKQADNKMPNLPAWHSKTGDVTGYTYTYTARLHETAGDSRKNEAMDYHHYPTTTTNTTLVSRSTIC